MFPLLFFSDFQICYVVFDAEHSGIKNILIPEKFPGNFPDLQEANLAGQCPLEKISSSVVRYI